MDGALYDEFGNYIGPDSDEDSNSDGGVGGGSGGLAADDGDDDWLDELDVEDGEFAVTTAGDASKVGGGGGAAAGEEAKTMGYEVVLHEDKRYYPDAETVFGDAEALVMDEDSQKITEPIIKPVTVRHFSESDTVPATKVSAEYLAGLMDAQRLIRNVAVIGHLHHGKTSLLDVLVQSTHADPWDLARDVRYTDARKDEQERGVSIKATPVSLVMPDLRGKSHLVHLIDCPGHVNFSGECTAALRAADSACLVVGAVEGVLLNTERLIKHALRQHVPLTLVINKVDRLILELKLPPADAYHKLVHTIDRVNAIIEQHSGGVAPQRLSPEIGNVCFASAQHGWCFSLLSFATLYVDHYWAPAAVPSRAADAAAAAAAAAEEGELDADATTPAAFGRSAVDASALARRLWGDRYFDAETGRFSRRPAHGGAQRSFVSFCLEPLYKVYSAVVGEESELLQATLAELGMQFRLKQLHIDAKPLMRLVMSRFFDGVRGFTSMVATHVPSPIAGAVAKVERSYLGQVDDADPLGGAMRRCEADADGPLVINVVKLVAAPDGLSFFAYGRIMCGTVRAGQRVRVLGETYSADDTEDMREEVVRNIFIPQARYQIAVDRASAGNCVLLEGVDAAIIKSATIVGCSPVHADAAIFAPLEFDTQATVKLAVEPLNPSELPKLLHGLRCVSKSYPLVSSRVEESGEHVVFGCGEMDLDCVMHDLREMYGGVEIKVADPVVAFCETVLETSHMPVFGDTPNGMNQFTLLAEPLEKGLAEDIEGGGVSLAWDSKHLSEYLCSKYEWDKLASRRIWAFGPGQRGTNVLLNDSLPAEVNQSLLSSVREHVVQGFQWGCREGPLCDEPLRNVKFKLQEASIAASAIQRGGGQVIPTARRVAYSAFLLAEPRLMEPVYHVEVVAPADVVEAVGTVLSRRRGHVTSEAPIPGSPLYIVQGKIPVIDSFGFETDLRVYTQGQAFCMQVFDHWAVVPGNPLDETIKLRPLEPAPPQHLARDFCLKVRRRKGLSDLLSHTRFMDTAMLAAYERDKAGEESDGMDGMGEVDGLRGVEY